MLPLLITVPAAAICKVAPELTVKLIVLASVPPLVNVCVPPPLKLIDPLPVLVSVMVPPVKVKFPEAFKVPTPAPLLRFRVPEVMETFPVTFNVLVVAEATKKLPPVTNKPPAIVTGVAFMRSEPVFEALTSRVPAMEVGAKFVLTVWDALFHRKFPKAWFKPAGDVATVPVTLQLDVAFHVAVGIVPPFIP